MRLSIPFAHLTLVLALFTAVTTFPGCGKKDQNNSAAQNSPAGKADARFATPDALIEVFNSHNAMEPVNADAALDLYHAENDLQKRYITLARNMIAYAKLDRLMLERFGERFDPRAPTDKKPMSPDQPAVITKREQDRGEATYLDSNGKQAVLHLVRVNSQWRISGSSLELDPDFASAKADLEKFELTARGMGAASVAVMPKIHDGTLTSPNGVRAAFATAWANATPLN